MNANEKAKKVLEELTEVTDRAPDGVSTVCIVVGRDDESANMRIGMSELSQAESVGLMFKAAMIISEKGGTDTLE